jgi:hypothetical protein
MNRLSVALRPKEADFIAAQLPCQRLEQEGSIYLSFPTAPLLVRAQVLFEALRYPRNQGAFHE